MKHIVDISDAKVSTSDEDVIITYSLGSCIGVCMYDRKARVGGMLHFQLPDSHNNPDKAKANPYMFADTGIKLLIDKLCSVGADLRRLQVKIAGGAQIMNDARMFQIGKRNYAAIRQIMWKKGIFIEKEDVGGSSARSLVLNMADGKVTVTTKDQSKEL
ncbi:MAG: chemotaxis protein CheD [Sedimentisphaerales bacterium]|nr:chemotaxis protein CheD [Sedimentisphaerales bacterium]